MFTKVFVNVLIITVCTVNVCWSFNFVFNDAPFRSLFNNFQSMGNDFGPVFEVNKNFKEPELEASASEFNPSVVIVDAGKAQTIPVETSWDQQNIQGPIFPFFRPNIWQSIFTGVRRPVPWWKGENICIERKVIEEGSEEESNKNTTSPTENDAADTNSDSISVVNNGEDVQMQISDSFPFTFSSQVTHCVDDENAHVCTTRVRNNKLNKTTIVRHECCHGYRRNQNGLPGCSAVNLKSIAETLNEMGSKHFADLLSSSSVEKRIQENENLTVFSPLDETLMALYNKKENEISPINLEPKDDQTLTTTIPTPQTTPSISISPAIAARHTLNGIYKLNDFTDGETLTTLDENVQLRVNIYNNMRKVITLNCVPIISGDNPTINGMIHSVERVLPSANKTIGQILDADQRFAKFTELLKEAGTFEKLNELNGQFTIFAPTNVALEKMKINFLDKLKSGHSCFKNLIETHIANKIICSSGIFGEMHLKTINSMQITLKRTYDYKLFAQNAELLERDIVGSNGVIHAISDLIISDSVEPFSKSIDTPVTKKFVQLLNETNLIDEFNSKEDATFFIPTDEAIQKLPQDVREKFLNNTEMILRFHITQPRLTNANFYNNELLVSSIGKSVRINLYGDFPQPVTRVTAQCANIVYQNKETCGGVIHLVDRVLFPSKDNVMAIIESQDGFEIFKQLLQVSKFTEKLSKENGPYTLLLPDDAAFRKTFSQKEIDEYLNNTNKATKLVQRHIIPEFVCCTGFNQMPFFFSLQQFRVLDGTSVSAIREFDGRIKVGSAQIRKCDEIANNGVVHFIDRVLYPKAMVNILPANSLFNMFLN